MPESMEGETLQQQIESFLAYAEGDVLLWHDPSRKYAAILGELSLPADVNVVREDGLTPLQLKVLVEDVDLDERLLVYRLRYRDVSASDWLAGIEARAEWFVPTSGAVLSQVSAAAEKFEAPEGIKPSCLSPTPTDASAMTGETRVPLSAALFPTETEYFDSLFRAGIVRHADIPAGVAAKPSFKTFLSRRAMAGEIIPYDEGSWITLAGLSELEIYPCDLKAFVEGALAVARAAGLPCFTVPALRAQPESLCVPSLPLLAYDFSDAFYTAVLTSQKHLINSAKLCGVRIFTSAGQSPRGRDVIEAIVRDAGSLYVDELIHLLHGTYGIPIARNQLLSLVKKTNLYLYRGVDKLYSSYEYFLGEVE